MSYLLLFCFLCFTLPSFSLQEERELSSPFEVAALLDKSGLIGGVLSPLSGQLVLGQTDLIAKGAENILLNRLYIPPYMPLQFNEDPKKENFFFSNYLMRNYRGWSYFPHAYLLTFTHKKGMRVRITEPSGVVLDFLLTPSNRSKLLSPAYGISNLEEERPNSKVDLRNIQIRRNNHQILVHGADGTIRTYAHVKGFKKNALLLIKETFPSGKILFYRYKDRQMEVVWSANPQASLSYSALRLHSSFFQASSGHQATYHYEKEAPSPIELKEKKSKTTKLFRPPALLKKVDSPFYAEERLGYNERFLLTSYQGQKQRFEASYAPFGEEPHFRINSLSFPSGEDNSFHPIYQLHYEVAIPGQKKGWTEVKNSDGTRTVYHLSKDLLVTKIDYFDSHNQLVKEKFYQFNNQQIVSIEVKGGGLTLYQTKFENNPRGDPVKESFIGNLTGNTSHESFTTKRFYSEDRLSLLLKEEEEGGFTKTFRYLPGTDLIIACFTQDREKILFREFSLYDDSHNLIQHILDDGSREEVNNLTDVTERHITHYRLKQNPPFIHMVEEIEESYLEQGVEKLLKRTHFSYDSQGNIKEERVYDADNQLAYTLFKTYNARGDLTSESNPLGQVAFYEYEERGLQTSCLPFSHRLKSQMSYDLQGRLREKKEEGEGSLHISQRSYDLHDRLIGERDFFGNEKRHTYDQLTHQIKSTQFPPISSSSETPLQVVTHTIYDALGRALSKTDANGETTYYHYNAYGSPIQITYPEGHSEYFRYNKKGELIEQVTLEGVTLCYERDRLGRVLSKEYFFQDRSVAKESFTYNAFHLLSQTDKEGYTTYYTYDGAGRRIREAREGRVTLYGYDALDRLSNITHENGENSLLISYKRDLLGRIVEEEKKDREGNLLYSVGYAYDEAGNQTEITKRVGEELSTEQFTYDPFNRLISHQDGEGYLTQVIYNESYSNSLGQKVLQKSIFHPHGLTQLQTFDALDHLVKEEKRSANEILSSQERYYDPSGNLMLQKDLIYEAGDYQKSHLLAYTYTPSHQVESLTRAFGEEPAKTSSFVYTPSGLLAQKREPSGVTLCYHYTPLGELSSLTSSDHTIDCTFTYNKLGDLLEASDHLHRLTIKREVDPFGNILQEAFPSGLSIVKSYDAFNRPLTTECANRRISYEYDPLYLQKLQQGSFVATYEHDLSGHLLQERVGDLGVVRYKRDLNGRITALIGPYFSQLCRYDAGGNLSENTLNGETIYCTYDGLSQLTSEKGNTYQADSLFNRTQKKEEPLISNELQEIVEFEGMNYQFDANGNLTHKITPEESLLYTYDALHRLTGLSKKEASYQYLYDPLGRRLTKISYEMAGNRVIEVDREDYLYEGDDEIASFDVEGRAKSIKMTAPLEHDRQAAVIELEGESFVPFQDIQGNIRGLVSPLNREIEEAYSFTAFGEERALSWKNPWRYASKRIDPDSCLIYFGKRDYDPYLGRWLTPDPAGFVDSVNLYQYVFNNPYRYRDLNGQCAFAIPLLIWGAELVLPSLTAYVAPLVYGAIVGTVAYGGYKVSQAIQARQHSSYSFNNRLLNSQTEVEEEKKKKSKDVYAPDRPLPTNKDGVPIPDTDTPHTQLGTKIGSYEKYNKAREFGYNGKHIRDIEFTDHGYPHNHTNPHQHRREENATGGTRTRESGEPVPEWSYK